MVLKQGFDQLQDPDARSLSAVPYADPCPVPQSRRDGQRRCFAPRMLARAGRQTVPAVREVTPRVMLVGMGDVASRETLRPLRLADADDILELLGSMDVAEAGATFTTGADVAGILTNDRTDLDRDSRVVSDTSGLAAFAAIEVLQDREYVRATLGMRPDAVGGATAVLLDWVQRRAQQVAIKRGWEPSVAVTWQLPCGLAEPTLRELGWVVVRRFNRLRRDLAPEIAMPPAPPGVTVRTNLTDEQAKQTHAVLEAALAGHWEHRPKTADRFLADERSTAGHDLSLWYLAAVAGQPAAAVIARRRVDQGWIGWVGTHPDYRGRGLGRLLLNTAIAELAHRGSTQVALDVDTGNDTGALRLYESVGFHVDYQANQWRFTEPAHAR